MTITNEGIYRLVYSSITGSKLSSREIRKLAELLSSGSEFVYLLQRGLLEFADSLEHSFAKQAQIEFDSNSAEVGSALSEIMLSRIQEDRVPKKELVRIMMSASKRAAKGLEPGKLTMRQIVHQFLQKAAEDEVQVVLALLGLAVDQDPYLSGIDRKYRGPA